MNVRAVVAALALDVQALPLQTLMTMTVSGPVSVIHERCAEGSLGLYVWTFAPLCWPEPETSSLRRVVESFMLPTSRPFRIQVDSPSATSMLLPCPVGNAIATLLRAKSGRVDQ
ncbi:hypothetical protein OG430_00870 [Streptomyces sp. NBC_01304]|nr:hypothetical protein OG430_00870 [Streptomyces sp. NBC_01304]